MIDDLARHDTRYVTPQELAEYWHTPIKNVYRWIEKGALPAERIGPRLLRIRTSDAVAFGEPPRDDDR